MSGQLALGLVAAAESEHWGGSVDPHLIDVINALAGTIPNVQNRKGTARERWSRPAAYLYANPSKLEASEALAVRRVNRPLRRTAQPPGPWLRLNGEPEGTNGYINARSATRGFAAKRMQSWSWNLDIAQRALPLLRSTLRSSRAALAELEVEPGSLPWVALSLRWSPAMRVAVEWAKAGLCPARPDWGVQLDWCMSRGTLGELAEDLALIYMRPNSATAWALNKIAEAST